MVAVDQGKKLSVDSELSCGCGSRSEERRVGKEC